MNLLYLSPHYPAHYSLFAERLADIGVKVLGVTDLHDDALPLALREALAGHYRVDSLDNTDQVLAAGDFFRERWGTIDRIESHLDPWLSIEAVLRERLNVPGFKPSDLAFVRRKSLMKKIFEKAGVPTGRGILVESYSQCLSFIDGKFPVFIKPDSGVGAWDTYTIRCEYDLKRFFTTKQSHPYYLEEYLTGVIESFDGLTDSEGKIVFHTGHVFNDDIHKIVMNNRNLAYYSYRQLPEDLLKFGSKIVQMAGIREKFFHIEFFRLPDGTLRALEINMRPQGGLTTHMFNYSADIDVYAWWARIVAAQPADFSFSRIYHCAYVGRKFDRGYAHSHENICSRLGEKLVHSQPMNQIEFSVMGNYGYLCRSPSEEEIKDMIDFILREA